MEFEAAVLTISDRSSRGEREDLSGEIVKEVIEDLGGTVVSRSIVPDDPGRISEELIRLCDMVRVDLVITTGGTGLSPRDNTPEATLQVIDREVPGIAEAMRAAGLLKTPHAMLSRAVCGIRGRALIINLPGSPRAVKENLEVASPVLLHALEILRGDVKDCFENKKDCFENKKDCFEK